MMLPRLILSRVCFGAGVSTISPVGSNCFDITWKDAASQFWPRKRAGSSSSGKTVGPLVTLHVKMSWNPYESHSVPLKGTLTSQDLLRNNKRSSQGSKSYFTVSADVNMLVHVSSAKNSNGF